MKEWLIVLICVLSSLFVLSVQAGNTNNFPFTNVTYYGIDQNRTNSIFTLAMDVTFTPDRSSLLAVDYNYKLYKFYKADLLNFSTFNNNQRPQAITFAAPNTYLVATQAGLFKTSDLATFTKLTGGNALGVTYDQASGLVYVSGSNQVTAYSLEPFAVVRSYGGLSTGTSSSQFYGPYLMAVDKQGGLWVADSFNNRVLHFAAGSTTADIVLGQPDFTSNQPAASASSLNGLYSPYGVALDESNDNLYVTDYYYTRVLRYRGPFTSGQAASGLLDAQADFACTYIRGIRVGNNADGSVRVVFADEKKIVSGALVPASATASISTSGTSTATSTASLSSTSTATASVSLTSAPSTSGTSTASATVTSTSTASLSATSDPSFTSTATPTTTVSLSGTSSVSASTSTASASSTSTASLSSSSPSFTKSLSRTRSLTRTLSNSRTLSRSTSGSRSVSRTPSNSRSYSRTRSASPPPGGRARKMTMLQ